MFSGNCKNEILHGLETVIATASKRYRLVVIRFADDFVILCEDLATLQAARKLAEQWLAAMGLTLKPSKTFITHTLHEHEACTERSRSGRIGFDFLGFTAAGTVQDGKTSQPPGLQGHHHAQQESPKASPGTDGRTCPHPARQ